MIPDNIRRAIKEAERFIKIAKKVNFEKGVTVYEYVCPGKESGACRRASMDLTRALAEMRKP